MRADLISGGTLITVSQNDRAREMKTGPEFLGCVAIVIAAALAFVGCGSMEEYAAKRREQLLAGYPLGKTTRAEVDERLRPADFSGLRPANGWLVFTPKFVADHIQVSEQRTGSSVFRFDRYLVPDGWSGGLCHLWFYYDEQDKLVDAEWKYHTD